MADYAPGSQGLLSLLEPWLKDNEVSEILVNRPQEVFVEKRGLLVSQEVSALTERVLRNLMQLIANENQQTFSDKAPLLSGSLYDGSRVQLVSPPTARHYTLSIRRKVVSNFTLDNYKQSNFYDKAIAAEIETADYDSLPDTEKALITYYQKKDWDGFIRHAIHAKKNIVISGGTSSGKTTYLNACLREIPVHERIITLEDVREIDTHHPNLVQLLATKGEQGIAKVSMQDLVQCCLRLRPDRIIMGEIRGREIMDFVSSCSTGHEGSITSVHANNPRIAFMRMTQMYKLNNVPSMRDEDILNELKEVIDIIVQVAKTPQGRQVQSIYYKYGHYAES